MLVVVHGGVGAGGVGAVGVDFGVGASVGVGGGRGGGVGIVFFGVVVGRVVWCGVVWLVVFFFAGAVAAADVGVRPFVALLLLAEHCFFKILCCWFRCWKLPLFVLVALLVVVLWRCGRC